MDFEKESFDQILSNQNTSYSIQTLVFSANNQLIYEGNNNEVSQALTRTVENQMNLYSLVDLNELEKDYYVAESITKGLSVLYCRPLYYYLTYLKNTSFK